MGNFSRDTLDRLKHYVGVRLQQGVPIVDADWNEQEDIRKYELQTFLKWFVGNGVPAGNNGFNITSLADPNDFEITGGDGTADGAGRILVDGWDAIIESILRYSEQTLYNDATLAAEWGVDPLEPLTTPSANRTDTAYLDIWEREVEATEDINLINPGIGVETCVRNKREWAVRVAENATIPPVIIPEGHVFYPLATLSRVGGSPQITPGGIIDLRQTNLNLRDTVNHLSLSNNPHNVTTEQIGALAASDYHFGNRVSANVLFTQADSNNATRTINLGFRPQIVWAEASNRAVLAGSYFGAPSTGHADLRTTILQQCAGTRLFRTSSAPFFRQDSFLLSYLSRTEFSDRASTPNRIGTLGARITAVSNTGLTIRFYRADPSGTGTGGGGTGSTPGTQALQNFQVRLRLLCFG